MKYTLRQLEVFLAIAKYRNISHAAEHLHMSQSAASAALLNLEQRYGVKLFLRNAKSLELSEEGGTMRNKAEALLAHAKQFELELQGHAAIGHLKVGASYTIGNHLAVNYLADYLADHPEANVEFEVANSPDVVAMVINFEVDIGMIEGVVNHPELKLIPWREDELKVFCAPHHPLAQKQKLTANDIRQVRWILREPDSGARQTFDRALAAHLPDMDIYLEFRHNEAIKRAVETGIGIGCLSEIVLANNFRNGELVPLELPKSCSMKRWFYFALKKDHYPKPAVEWWIEKCRS